jgi:hypothetical protein
LPALGLPTTEINGKALRRAPWVVGGAKMTGRSGWRRVVLTGRQEWRPVATA